MASLIGEFDCKIDAKFRIMLPANLKKQFSTEDQFTFVINRGIEKCLNLYPQSEWKKISTELEKLNIYNQKNRELVRYFFRGATEITLDSSNRILLPQNLLQYAGIDKEIVLFAYFNKVEIWGKEEYENFLANEPKDFSKMVDKILGGNNTIDNNDDVK